MTAHKKIRLVNASVTAVILWWHAAQAIDLSQLLCSDKFCKAYRDTVGCPRLAMGCLAPNATHSGTQFPSPTPCNCCDVCMEHINEGEFCAIGEPGAPTPSAFCGPGLTCKRRKSEEHPKCWPIDDTECTRQRIAYDRALKDNPTGHIMERPSCNGDGLFSPIKCIPGQLCFCVDDNGARIFGEDVYSERRRITMKCECSRLNAKFRTMIGTALSNTMTSRCMDDGSYDPMQCMNDTCTCVERFYGTVDNDFEVFNSTETRFTQMPCFDRRIHSDRRYLHECEAKQFELLDQVDQFVRAGKTVLDFDMNDCDPNGWYKSVQRQGNWTFCARKDGQQIDEFRAASTSIGGMRMNCRCARAALIAPETTPKCCLNGNYPSLVCSVGECYCLNENGEQLQRSVPESQRFELPCYMADNDRTDTGDTIGCGEDNHII